ncbi:B-cell receptor-associated protein 31-like-domain-containing protein [Spinellus fusiger]|nr:B-cell receptor-associated protein 31-like-domain-containing protein [Spinellus fusiger]
MTLYYAIVFGILAFEVTVFFLFMAPLPLQWKKSVFNWLATSPTVAHAQYIMRIVFGFIFVLFLDSVNRLKTINEATGAGLDDQMGGSTVGYDIRAEASVAAKKFYAQRNMYLTGFTLFLLMILNSTYTMTLENLRLEEKVNRLEALTPESTAKNIDDAVKESTPYKMDTKLVAVQKDESKFMDDVPLKAEPSLTAVNQKAH